MKKTLFYFCILSLVPTAAIAGAIPDKVPVEGVPGDKNRRECRAAGALHGARRCDATRPARWPDRRHKLSLAGRPARETLPAGGKPGRNGAARSLRQPVSTVATTVWSSAAARRFRGRSKSTLTERSSAGCGKSRRSRRRGRKLAYFSPTTVRRKSWSER